MARRRDPVAVVASPPAAGRRDRGLIRQVPRAIDATVQASLLLTNPVRCHGNLPCELGRRDTQIIQLVLEDFSGMNGSHEHCLAPFFSDSPRNAPRSEEPTSELQSLMRTSYAVF